MILKKKTKKTFLFQFFCARKSHAICTDCKGFFQVFNCDVQKKLYWVPFWCRWIVFYYLFAECEMCNSFSLVCYLTSRMYDGGVCFCFIFVWVFFWQIENEDIHRHMIWSSFNSTSRLVLNRTHTQLMTHLYKEFISIALTCRCVESALASFFTVSIQLQVLMSGINFILHDFDNSTCVHELKKNDLFALTVSTQSWSTTWCIYCNSFFFFFFNKTSCSFFLWASNSADINRSLLVGKES